MNYDDENAVDYDEDEEVVFVPPVITSVELRPVAVGSSDQFIYWSSDAEDEEDGEVEKMDVEDGVEDEDIEALPAVEISRVGPLRPPHKLHGALLCLRSHHWGKQEEA
jgi:hypothetical protein